MYPIKKILKNLLLSLFILVMILFLLITAIGCYGYLRIKYERLELKNGQHIRYEWDSLLGYKSRPNTQTNLFDLPNAVTGIKSNREDSLILFTTDSFGRRIQPFHEGRKKHLIFFGCSYTYGEIVGDQETYPFYLGLLDSASNIYNYALSGYSTQHMLEILKRGISGQVAEPNGTAIYMFIDNHKERVAYDPFTLMWGYGFVQYYLKDNTELKSYGTFYDAEKMMTSFWKGVGVLKLWPIFIPVYKTILNEDEIRMDQGRYELLAKIVAQSKCLYLKEFPHGRFITAIFPGESTNIIPYLQHQHIEVMDLSHSIDLKAMHGIGADGYHPNKIGDSMIAQSIYTWFK